MTSLYNCRHDGDQYRFTKFDSDMNVESTYLTTLTECDCPAGVRPMCRHREMLPKFMDREKIGTGWMFDYDRGGWVQVYDDPEPEPTVSHVVGQQEVLQADANAAGGTKLPGWYRRF